jgi:hypothetical protein
LLNTGCHCPWGVERNSLRRGTAFYGLCWTTIFEYPSTCHYLTIIGEVVEHIGILTAIALALAAYRLTRLVKSDEVPFGPIRRRAEGSGSKLEELMFCPFCLSVWFGGILALGQFLLGDGWGWQVFVGAMALSAVVSLLASLAPQSFE